MEHDVPFPCSLTTYQFPVSWTTWIQQALSDSLSSKCSIIFSSHLLLIFQLDHFPSAIPITICQQVYSSPFVTHLPPDLVTTIIFGEEYKLCRSWLRNPSLLLLGSSVNILFKSLWNAVAKLNLYVTVTCKLTVRGPCIIIYSYNKSQRDALFLKSILIKKSTCFGQIYCPSSGISILYKQQ